MAMELEKVVPIGRSLDEYIKMFNLSKKDLQKSIIGVADGPASFNAEATFFGSKVISVDPIYEFSGEEIEKRFNEVIDNIISQVKDSPNDWVWSYHENPDKLCDKRKESFKKFIADYDKGRREKRYQIGKLPKLNYHDNEFDLALCSHFLFLYSDFYDYQFVDISIKEMLRISKEVRIFPLLSLNSEPSEYIGKIFQDFTDTGQNFAMVQVEYELQKGGNKMLQIIKD